MNGSGQEIRNMHGTPAAILTQINHTYEHNNVCSSSYNIAH